MRNDERGKPWDDWTKSKPFAALPFGLVSTVFRGQEIKDWRKKEYDAGMPSGLEDFYRAHGFCEACRSRGVNLSIFGWDGNTPLFEECRVCGGTGRLIPPSIETKDSG